MQALLLWRKAAASCGMPGGLPQKQDDRGIEVMARGWESKDVESQLEAAGAERGSAPAARLTPEQQSIARRRETLELDRCRLLNDIERSTHPRYQEQLQAALAHVEAEIAKLV